MFHKTSNLLVVQDLYYKKLLKNKMVNERSVFIDDYIKMRASVRFLIKNYKILQKNIYNFNSAKF